MKQPLPVLAEIKNLIERFEEAYFHGIPALLNSPFGGYLAFVCMCSESNAWPVFDSRAKKENKSAFASSSNCISTTRIN